MRARELFQFSSYRPPFFYPETVDVERHRRFFVTSPENIGTFNYGKDPISLDHVLLDVIPYMRWKNSKDDKTSFWQRVFGSHKK